jgi:AmmeMemoRadiSam system protein A
MPGTDATANPAAPPASGGNGSAGEARGRLLLALARAAIAESLGLPVAAPAEQLSWLREPGATFVTLKCEGRLRGCVGSIRARRPLGEDVRANARAAAFADPRFPPLTPPEWRATRVEVSLLTPPEPLAPAPSEEAAATALVPGIDGLVLEYRHHGATFLPQVWEQLRDPAEFLAHLKHKAGLPRTFWSPEIRLLRYRVEKWAEEE